MGDSYTVGGLDHLAMDIDADGDNLYIAALNDSSNPEILKISKELDEDATSEYAPGSGSVVNVLCGRIQSGLVWASGDFGETVKIVKYDSYFYEGWEQMDQNLWYDTVQPMMLGPEDDYRLYVHIPDQWDLYESYFLGDTGPYWIPKNQDTDFQFGAFDRLSYQPQQIIAGVDINDPYWYPPTYWYDRVFYSPNEGTAFGDITLGLDFEVSVTTVIYG